MMKIIKIQRYPKVTIVINILNKNNKRKVLKHFLKMKFNLIKLKIMTQISLLRGKGVDQRNKNKI